MPLAPVPLKALQLLPYQFQEWIRQLDLIVGSLGTVSSVAVSGTDGVGVAGSPITTSGTITLSLGDITPTGIFIGVAPAAGDLLHIHPASGGSIKFKDNDLSQINLGETNAVILRRSTGDTNFVIDNQDGDIFIRSNDATDIFLADDSTANIILGVGGGNSVFGFSTAQVLGGGVTPTVQILGTAAASSRLGIGRWSADTGGNNIFAAKSRNATIGSHTVVVSGDSLLAIVALGSDGDEFLQAANITFISDGTPGNGDMPGAITLGTTPDGSGTIVSRIKIGNQGNVILNNSGSALATTATGGFTYIPTCAGVPTGVPTVLPTGAAPCIIDTTNNRFYFYSTGAWRNAGP